jgi:hypothetical protein
MNFVQVTGIIIYVANISHVVASVNICTSAISVQFY